MTLLDTLRPSSAAAPSDQHRAATIAGQRISAAPAQRLNSAWLFGAGHEIEIEHGPSVYRLRITSLGKLILTK